jgi:hypothetical protein
VRRLGRVARFPQLVVHVFLVVFFIVLVDFFLASIKLAKSDGTRRDPL